MMQSLVELVGDDGVLDKQLEGDDLQRGLVGGFEDDGAAGSRLLDLQPARGADTPTVAGFEASEAVLGHGGGEVIAQRLRRGEEGLVDDTADGMDSEVIRAGLAAACAIEAGHWGTAAGGEGLAEDILAARLGFSGQRSRLLDCGDQEWRSRQNGFSCIDAAGIVIDRVAGSARVEHCAAS